MGYNHFAKLWKEAKSKQNGFVPISIKWNEPPNRGEIFRRNEIKREGMDYWLQEFECKFIGSSDTLIDNVTLENLFSINPIEHNRDLKIYKHHKKGHLYMISVDCAEGKGRDYNVFTVIDLSTKPNEIVAVYRNNTVSYKIIHAPLHDLINKYGGDDVLLVVENNSVGNFVIEMLQDDFEVDCSIYAEKPTELGLRTTKKTKRIGCLELRSNAKHKKILITDANMINEFLTFVRKGESWEANSHTDHDDLVMTMINYSYVLTTDFYKSFIDHDKTTDYDEEIADYMGDYDVIGYVDGAIEDEGNWEVM